MTSDTLHHIAQPVIQAQQSNTGFDLVYYVNNFYEQAWNKMIWVVGIILGIGGVVLPILIQIWQRRTLRLSEAQMRVEITSAIESARAEINQQISDLITNSNNQLIDTINVTRNGLKDEIDSLLNSTKNDINIAIEESKGEVINNAINIIEEKIKVLEKEAERVNYENRARFAQAQANTYVNAQAYSSAFADYIICANFYCKCGKIEVAENVLKHILENIKSENLTKELIDNAFTVRKIQMLGELKLISKNGDKIKDLASTITSIYNSLSISNIEPKA